MISLIFSIDISGILIIEKMCAYHASLSSYELLRLHSYYYCVVSPSYMVLFVFCLVVCWLHVLV